LLQNGNVVTPVVIRNLPEVGDDRRRRGDFVLPVVEARLGFAMRLA